MKKNKMMRLASLLLVMCLLTTSVISGTFAKYTTSDSAKDSARVAKWGVTVEIDSNDTDSTDLDLFNVEYTTDETDEGAYSGSASVKSNTNLVAPGTTGSVNFKISGTPEVASRITVKLEETKAIQLGEGSYTLEAGKWLGDEKTVTIGEGSVYEPIYFYLYAVPAEGQEAVKGEKLTMSELSTALNGTGFNKDVAPGNALDAEYTLEWHWDFEGTFTVNEQNVADFLDTYLGDKMANSQDPEDDKLVEAFKLSITVEQID